MADIGGILRSLDGRQEQGVRRILLRSYQGLTTSSPVRTGFFRAGWSPSTGAPSGGPQNPPPDEEATRRIAESLFSAHSREAESLSASYTLSNGIAFIANPVSYGPALNMGTSAQAPAMFVEMAIASAVAQTKRERLS